MKTIGLTSRLHARLMGTCFISVGADGQLSTVEGNLSTTAGGDVAHDTGNLTTGPKDIVADPGAPAAATTTEDEPEGDKPVEEVIKEETAEEKAAREAKESDPWTNRDKSKDVALSEEQQSRLDAMKDLTVEQKAGVAEFTLETNTTGDLSEASRVKAAKLWGVPREMVDNYVDGIKAANARIATTTDTAVKDAVQGEMTPTQQTAFKLRMDALYSEVGSKETWDQFAAWATGGGLTEAEQTDLASAIDASPNVGVMAAKQFVSRWKEQGGAGGPADVTRNAGQQRVDNQNPAVKPFGNRSEEQEALNKRDASGRSLMDVDPQYRASIEARMGVSNYNNVEQSFFKGAGGMMGSFS